MIVAADWVVTLAGRPIKNGAVLVRASRIDAIGALDDLRAAHPGEPVEPYDGCVIIPGLVNAHTRLSLTVLRGLTTGHGTMDGLRQIGTASLAMSNDDFAASASLGALECLRCGVTSVGDIGHGPEPPAACGDLGVGGVFYWEVRGIDAHSLAGELAEMEFPSEEGACTSGRVRCGLSPQSVFMSGPGLIKAEWHVAQRHHTGFAIHVAESAEEHELTFRGTGPLSQFAHTFARDFVAPGTGTVSYLHRLGVLEGAVALGCVHLEVGEVLLLKREARGVVLCALSSDQLRQGAPPVSDLFAGGVRIALGTGSPAVNPSMDVFAEVRAIRAMDPSLNARRLLKMVALDAARVLGIDDVCGSLEEGKQADLAIVRTGRTEDPEGAVVKCGGPDAIEAVLTAGVWRVRDGKPALPTASTERAADRARAVAAEALGRA